MAQGGLWAQTGMFALGLKAYCLMAQERRDALEDEGEVAVGEDAGILAEGPDGMCEAVLEEMLAETPAVPERDGWVCRYEGNWKISENHDCNVPFSAQVAYVENRYKSGWIRLFCSANEDAAQAAVLFAREIGT